MQAKKFYISYLNVSATGYYRIRIFVYQYLLILETRFLILQIFVILIWTVFYNLIKTFLTNNPRFSLSTPLKFLVNQKGKRSNFRIWWGLIQFCLKIQKSINLNFSFGMESTKNAFSQVLFCLKHFLKWRKQIIFSLEFFF